jgi:uncharacterized membrane protein
MVDAEEVTDQEELRFAKKQQWYVATASVTLSAGVIALLKGSRLSDRETIFAIGFIAIVTIAGVVVLGQLQHHLFKERRKSEREAPWHRLSDVFGLLTFFVVTVAVGVGYCILHPLQPLPSGH